MRTLFVCLLAVIGLAGCADRLRPPWLPAPVTDDPEAHEIMGGTEPASPYLLQPYRPQRPWTWPTTAVRASSTPRPVGTAFDPKRVSRKLDEGAPHDSSEVDRAVRSTKDQE